MTLATIVLIALAVPAALAYNRRTWRPRQAAGRTGADGFDITDIAGPLVTLAVLLLVFILVQGFASWAAAGRAETNEATATLLLFREADLVEDPALRQVLRTQVVCYATSVIEQEWPAMARDRISSVPTYWAGRIRESGMRQLRGGDRAIAGEEIVERDTERTRARQERLGEARPGVPAALYALILVAVTMALGLIAVITASGVAPGVHVVVVVAASMLFTSTLLLIRDLDQPYSGATGREPTQTEFVRAQMQDDLTGTLPCDARGLPTRDPAFRLATSPLR